MTEKEIMDMVHLERYTNEYLIEIRDHLFEMIDDVNSEISSRDEE